MKTIFNNLFKYDYHTNQKILKAILDNPAAPADCTRFMSHIINTQQVWLGRIDPGVQKEVGIWDVHEKTLLEDKINESYTGWANYLKNAEEEDFLKILSYKNSKGDTFENRVLDILYHVINHGTHHRAQISLLLRQSGIEPPITDYIFYMREGK